MTQPLDPDVIPAGDPFAPWCDLCGAEHNPCDGDGPAVD